MASLRNKFVTASQVLASAVANNGTFTLSYPAGSSQLSFTAGLAGTGAYVVLNGNDKWALGSPGIAVSYGASLITVTNQSGYSWPAGMKVDMFFDQKKGRGRHVLTLPIFALSGISAADVVTSIRPGIEGYIEYWEFVTGVPVTTGSKLASLKLTIDTTDVTGGVIALTSAAATPLGKVVAASDITAANLLARESVLSVKATSVTAFVEGSGYLLIYIRPLEADSY